MTAPAIGRTGRGSRQLQWPLWPELVMTCSAWSSLEVEGLHASMAPLAGAGHDLLSDLNQCQQDSFNGPSGRSWS